MTCCPCLNHREGKKEKEREIDREVEKTDREGRFILVNGEIQKERETKWGEVREEQRESEKNLNGQPLSVLTNGVEK